MKGRYIQIYDSALHSDHLLIEKCGSDSVIMQDATLADSYLEQISDEINDGHIVPNNLYFEG